MAPVKAPAPTFCPVTAADTAPIAAPAIAEVTYPPAVVFAKAATVAPKAPEAATAFATYGAAKGITIDVTTATTVLSPFECSVGLIGYITESEERPTETIKGFIFMTLIISPPLNLVLARNISAQSLVLLKSFP